MPRKKTKTKVKKTKPKTKTIIQPEINIGLIGHVDHGKTTLTEKFSGKWADTHSEELKKGITIRLGYADCTFYYDKKTKKYSVKPSKDSKILRKISLVDAPGHESLMATMLSGAAIMDGALLLIAANEKCPQPQTREHLMALEISGVDKVIIVQNKIDLVSKEEALRNYKEIKKFIKNTKFKDAPIIPISAQHNINVDMLIETIEKNIPTPKRDTKLDPLMFIARSFDVNKPGTKIDNIKGGVLGGAIKKGILKIGDEIEIKPGYQIVKKQKKKEWKSLKTKITYIMSGSQSIQEAGPGGSIGLLTLLDPCIVKSDKLVGKVVGIPGKLSDVLHDLNLEIHLLERVVGAKEELKVEPIKMNETLMLNVNSAATVGVVNQIGKTISCRLKLPICAEKGSRVTISRMIGNRFRLIGYGVIK